MLSPQVGDRYLDYRQDRWPIIIDATAGITIGLEGSMYTVAELPTPTIFRIIFGAWYFGELGDRGLYINNRHRPDRNPHFACDVEHYPGVEDAT